MQRQEMIAATKAEIPSTTRIYLMEFLFESRWLEEQGAWHRFETTYRGRVRPEDVTVRENAVRERRWELWIRRWNMFGEYKDLAEANRIGVGLKRKLGAKNVKVVLRNSRTEHQLKAYSKVRLVGDA